MIKAWITNIRRFLVPYNDLLFLWAVISIPVPLALAYLFGQFEGGTFSHPLWHEKGVSTALPISAILVPIVFIVRMQISIRSFFWFFCANVAVFVLSIAAVFRARFLARFEPDRYNVIIIQEVWFYFFVLLLVSGATSIAATVMLGRKKTRSND
jgi:hypothetical protein